MVTFNSVDTIESETYEGR